MLVVCYQKGKPMVPLRLLVGLLISAISPPTALAQIEREHMSPLWVLRRPKQEGYFVGIGVAQREENLPESKDRAFKRALENIAAQIETSVLGEVYMKETEEAGEMRQEYRAEIKTMVSATLEGVQIIDTWEDTENCWVYARLSVARFERLRQEKIERARRLAFNFFSQADELEADGTAEALSFYLQALKPLHDALGDPLRVIHRGKTITLDTEIPRRIRAILSAIELEASPVNTPLKQGTTIDVPLTVRAFFKEEKGTRHTVNGMPIRFAFEKGRGDLVARVWTGNRGTAISRLREIHDPASIQVVQAKIDLACFVQDTSDSTLHHEYLKFSAPYATFQLDILQQKVYVITDESNLGYPLEFPYIQPIVKEHLGEAGLGFADRPGQADLVIEIGAKARQGNRFQDIYFAFLDMTVSVRNRDSGDELFYTSLTNVKGSGTSYEQAGIMAFQKAGGPLKEIVLPNLLDELNR